MTATCRYCARLLTRELINLGQQPLANDYLAATAEAIAAERTYPLRVMICDGCFLVQVEESVPADAIFHHEYAYFSSFSASWVAHAQRYAVAMIERFGLGPASKVVGVEPAGKCAEAAREKGVDTVVEFFNRETALRLAGEGHAADLTAANNVLAHVPKIDDFVAGFAAILKPEGVATFEFPHLLRMIAETQFDTIYHEHYSYLSLGIVERVLSGHGLRVFDIEHLPTHGGSIRVFACRADARHEEMAAVEEARQAERAARLDHPDGYAEFAGRAAAMRDGLRRFLDAAKARGDRVAGYGAAAKGNTFLNFCSADATDIAFVVDQNPEKQGRLLPGSHITVWAPEALAAERPEMILILPWNLAGEIATENAYVADWGGRFVVAAPSLRVL
jgi:hypothetical protein